jgi:hypothetical protein
MYRERTTSNAPLSILTRCSGVAFTAAMPNIESHPNIWGGWELYGGRLVARVPAKVTFTPRPDDRDPLDFRVVMVVDIFGGRLVCASLTAERLNEDSPGITGEDLRRIPVASYVQFAAARMRVLQECTRVDDDTVKLTDVRQPPADFAKDGMTDEALEQIARIYAAVQAVGGKPSGVLLSVYGMPRATSSRWLSVARRRGILVEEHRRLTEPTNEQLPSIEYAAAGEPAQEGWPAHGEH